MVENAFLSVLLKNPLKSQHGKYQLFGVFSFDKTRVSKSQKCNFYKKPMIFYSIVRCRFALVPKKYMFSHHFGSFCYSRIANL